MDMCDYFSKEKKPSPFLYLLSAQLQERSVAIHTVFWNVSLGSALAFQLSDLKETNTTIVTVVT